MSAQGLGITTDEKQRESAENIPTPRAILMAFLSLNVKNKKKYILIYVDW
jgi:hypothetical protein